MKMLKKWKRNKQIPLRSFYLEMMVLGTLQRWPGSYAEAVRMAFAGVAQLVRSGYPDPGLFVAADISTPGSAQQVIDRAGERFGVLDILVHTVGGSHAAVYTLIK